MEDIIIFGRGYYYHSKEKSIKKRYNIAAFLDNMVNEAETDNGVKVFNPRYIDQLPKYPIILMAARFIDMWRQLLELGVDEKRIYFGVNLKPYYDDSERIVSKEKDIQSRNGQIILCYGGEEYSFSDEKGYKKIVREIYKKENPYIELLAQMPMVPVSRRVGLERGKAVDRYYIEKFMEKNSQVIQGDVMEIAEHTYTYQYGKEITHAYALHVNGWGKDVIKGNLATGEGINGDSVDCLICTQTVQFIYDIDSVIKNIYKLLKPGGTSLVTVAGIAQISLYDYHNWGEYWRFTLQSIEQLFIKYFEKDKVEICSYGNVKIAVAMLYGLCVEDLEEEDFTYNDEQYPVIISVAARK